MIVRCPEITFILVFSLATSYAWAFCSGLWVDDPRTELVGLHSLPSKGTIDNGTTLSGSLIVKIADPAGLLALRWKQKQHKGHISREILPQPYGYTNKTHSTNCDYGDASDRPIARKDRKSYLLQRRA